MPKKYFVDREPFLCETCGRLVTVEEQVRDNYHQKRFCREHYLVWKKEYVREAVKKYREKKKAI